MRRRESIIKLLHKCCNDEDEIGDDGIKNELYTIGHSQHKMEYFLQMLKTQGINYVLDVRSTPYSQFATEYNKENIRGILKNNNI